MCHYSTEQFTYSGRSKLFFAEAAELRGVIFTRIYDDAADLGLYLHSSKTGSIATFYLESVDQVEGDILSWKLLPTIETVRAYPGLKDTSLIIIND
jgi:hypothetical protein